jgi:hypothetical protein
MFIYSKNIFHPLLISLVKYISIFPYTRHLSFNKILKLYSNKEDEKIIKIFLMKKLLLFIALSLFVLNNALAQTPDSTNFFPHHKGDMWEYLFTDGTGYDTVQVIITVDSTDTNGVSYITEIGRSINPVAPPIMVESITNYRVNSLNEVYTDYYTDGAYIKNPLIYKLNAQLGESWSLDTSGNNAERCRIRSMDTNLIFGEKRIIKDYDFYLGDSSYNPPGLDRYEVKLAEGLGMMWKGGGDAIGNLYLKGAVINGILYGDTTKIITGIKNNISLIPKEVELYQNYPNPFNPSTTIKFEVVKGAELSLIVYDLQGKETVKLIDGRYYYPGIYSITWDGNNRSGYKIANGIYFYALNINGKTIVKSMVYLK